jgi:hypothetical protein
MNYEELKSDIVCAVDTGSCKEYIIKDVLAYNEYNEEEISSYIDFMLKENLLIDRGAYLVVNWKMLENK